MDGNKQSCLQVFGLLLLVLIFTIQAQASFPLKPKTDVSSALEQARSEMKQVIAKYEHDHQFDLNEEIATSQNEVPAVQNETPAANLMAANRGK